jgi:CRP-like cAMP-binding protein
MDSPKRKVSRQSSADRNALSLFSHMASLHRLPHGAVEELSRSTLIRDYEPRQIIFFPRDPCNLVYWLLQGQARIYRNFPDGKEVSLWHAFAGDLLSASFLRNSRYMESYAEALTYSRVALIPVRSFLHCMEVYPRMAKALCERLEQRIHFLANRALGQAGGSLGAQLAQLLLWLAESQDPREQACVHASHQELANLLGCSRVAITLALGEFRKNSLIRMYHKRIVILDAAGLRRAASAELL